jgi:hypothetical protein
MVDTHKIDRKTNVNKPMVFVQYNKNMGGVDKLDQQVKPYQCLRKIEHWYQKLFRHFLDISVHNASVIFNEVTGKMSAA